MITTNSHNCFLAPLSRSPTKILKPFLCYGYLCILLNVGPHQPTAAVFLTHSSNKLQLLTLSDSNFQVNQKKLKLSGVPVIGSSKEIARKSQHLPVETVDVYLYVL